MKNIIVCIKQTPKSDNIKIDPATGCLIRTGAESAINPFDEFALEEGIRIKERLTAQGKTAVVNVITMGPPQAEAVLRTSVAKGADKVFHLSDIAFAGSDTWATSYALSKGIQKIGNPYIIICGKQTNDSDTGHIGAQISAWLKYPNSSFVRKVSELGDANITVERLVEDGTDTINLSTPAVLSVVKEINKPRIASISGRISAKTFEITTWTADDIKADKTKLGMKNSPTKVVKSFTPKREANSIVIEGATSKERANNLVKILKENQYA